MKIYIIFVLCLVSLHITGKEIYPDKPLDAEIYTELQKRGLSAEEYMDKFIENAKSDPVLAKKYKHQIIIYNRIKEIMSEDEQ